MARGYATVGQRGGGLYPGIEQPSQPLQGLFDARTDPLGIDLKQRSDAGYDEAMNKASEEPGGSEQAQHLHDTLASKSSPWGPWFQAVNEAAGGRNTQFSGPKSSDLGYDTTGFGAGQETYGRHRMHFAGPEQGIASDTSSTFNTTGPGAMSASKPYAPTYNESVTSAQQQLRNPYKPQSALSGLRDINYGR